MAPRTSPEAPNSGAAYSIKVSEPPSARIDIDDDAADFSHIVCGAIHRAVAERHRLAVDKILQPRSFEVNIPKRRVLGIVEAQLSGERSIHPRRFAFGIVGDGDADRKKTEHRLEGFRPFLKIETELSNELEGLEGHGLDVHCMRPAVVLEDRLKGPRTAELGTTFSFYLLPFTFSPCTRPESP